MNIIKNKSMMSHAKELPNLCSLAGLLCALFAIIFAVKTMFLASIISVLWAVVFDWYDGIIARKMKGRTKQQGEFGGQLDSLIDIVSFGILPAVLLLSYADYSMWFIPGAFVILATAAIRLSYFNVYGLLDNKTYKGLALDNNILILAFVFLFETFFTKANFSILLYLILMALSVLNLSSIPTPKFSQKWVYALLLYVIAMSVFFGLRIYS